MNSINELFNKFAVAYQHSLYAIEQEEYKANRKKEEGRNNLRKKFDLERSKTATVTSNKLMATLHKLNEICEEINSNDNTVIRIAEYLNYGKIRIDNLNKMFFSDTSIPCITPFLGHRNIILESRGDECHTTGLQFAVQALLQTASGQLAVTVVNPELRPEFSVFTRLPEFQMLTKGNEIRDFFSSISEDLVEVDSMLQGHYRSLVDLRKVAQQPVGKLRLIIIQDLPYTSEEFLSQITKVVRGAPRAGIAVLVLSNKNSAINNKFVRSLSTKHGCSFFEFTGNQWTLQETGKEKFTYEFPNKTREEISNDISKIIEEAKKSSVITIPFRQIECMDTMWTENSTENITFNLGKSGLDTISVCIGDKVSQHHNILISGAVGKGKSNLLEVMIHSLCWRYSPKELELYLLDFKDGLTFKPYSDKNEKSWLPHAKMLGLESDRDVGLAVLKDLENERLKRAELFRNAPDGGAKNYEDYRKKYSSNSVPRILLVIDEYQKLFEINDDIAEEASILLENIVRQGRACAIHVVLASQSISGAAGLLGKDERIYAQFPVRIGLQNTISESYSLFGIGNDAAAQLRVRGEAVINENYGLIESNKKFTVAYAEQKETKALRQAFCKKNEKQFPVIFNRQDYIDFSMIVSEIKKWRSSVEKTGIIYVPIGIRLSVRKDVISLPFMNDTGRNIAILGSAENLQKEGIAPGQTNIAIGMVQSIALSLALQHPDGNARFVLLDGLRQDVFLNSNMCRWLQLMERFGFPVECVDASDSVEWLTDFKQEINDFGADENTYILCLGMERYSNFSEM